MPRIGQNRVEFFIRFVGIGTLPMARHRTSTRTGAQVTKFITGHTYLNATLALKHMYLNVFVILYDSVAHSIPVVSTFASAAV